MRIRRSLRPLVSAERKPRGECSDAGSASTLRAGGRLLVLRLVSYALLFVSGVVVSRSLGPAGRATYALPLNFAQIMAVITALSLDSSTAAMVARGEASVPTFSPRPHWRSERLA